MTSPSELAVIVAALMHFYAVTDTDPEIRRAQFDMFWLPELGEFEAAIVRQACAEWQRRPKKEAPTPGQLRAICIELQANAKFRALPKPGLMPEAEQIAIADIWARNRGFRSMAEMQRSPGFTGGSIKVGPYRWRRFEPIRPPVIVAPLPKPEPKPEPPKRPPPQWITERDTARGDAQRQALGLDKIDQMVDRYVADSIKRVPADPADEAA